MILVTGGTGLVGSHLLYHLTQQEDKIRAVCRPDSDLQRVKKVFGYYTSQPDIFFKKIEWVEASLNDVSDLQTVFHQITQVYHCAAIVSFDPKDYHIMRKVNIEGTENIVNLSILNKIEKLCFVSSIATLSKSVNGKEITEENYWTNSEGKSGYAITKQGAETEVWRASQEDIDVVIVNPGVILGPGFWEKGTGKLFDKIYKGFKYYTEGVTGFVGVNDVARIMMQLMKSNIKNERFILVAENVSFKDVFFNIADHLGVKRPNKKVSPFLSEFGWKLAWLKGKLSNKVPELTKYSARAAQEKKYYSSEKIKKALPYTFEPLEKTIKNVSMKYLKELT